MTLVFHYIKENILSETCGNYHSLIIQNMFNFINILSWRKERGREKRGAGGWWRKRGRGCGSRKEKREEIDEGRSPSYSSKCRSWQFCPRYVTPIVLLRLIIYIIHLDYCSDTRSLNKGKSLQVCNLPDDQRSNKTCCLMTKWPNYWPPGWSNIQLKGDSNKSGMLCFKLLLFLWILDSILNVIFWLHMAKIRAKDIGIQEFVWKSSKCESKIRK